MHFNGYITSCKGTTIPVQACTDPEGSRKLSFSDIKTVGI